MSRSVDVLKISRFDIADGYRLEEITSETRQEIRILDRVGRVVFQNLPEEDVPSQVASAITLKMQSLSTAILQNVDLLEEACLQKFLKLSLASREFLLGRSGHRFDVRVIDLFQENSDSLWSVEKGLENVELKFDDLLRVIHLSESERFCEALASGCLKWPSIFGQYNVEARLLFIAFDAAFVIAEDRGIRYYVGLSLTDIKAYCVYIPLAGLCFGWNSSWHSISYAVLSSRPSSLPESIQRLLLLSDANILRWLTEPVLTNGQMMWPANDTHLGHYIWNELTGLEKIVAALDASKVEVWQLSNKDATSFYGPLSWIFPEFEGCIRKDAASCAEMNALLVASQKQVVRVSGIIVTQTVRHRVQAAIKASPNAGCLAAMGDEILKDKAVLLLGLREGKRVLLNTVDFYIQVIDRLQKSLGNLAVLIDGLNSAPGANDLPFKIHYGDASDGSMAVEKRVSENIASFCREKAVPVISLIGTSMDTNLNLLLKAKAFLAPWGGGLAKYRWFMDLPGYVVASAKNLSHPHMLSIYHSDLFTENKSPLIYADGSGIEDAAECDFKGPSSVDYMVKPQVFDDAYMHLLKFLQSSDAIQES